MKRFARTVLLLILGMFVSCNQPENSPRRQDPELPTGCQEHVELISAKEWADEMGKTELWILQNHKINLWKKPTPEGRGRKVGGMIPGSRAAILSKGTSDYQVLSPLDQSVGWISKIQVKRTLYQDVETREACQP